MTISHVISTILRVQKIVIRCGYRTKMVTCSKIINHSNRCEKVLYISVQNDGYVELVAKIRIAVRYILSEVDYLSNNCGLFK